ncbi:hypothetical protein NDU88_007215 [Pleurodeles waltl]|uniref:Uncharacterized protein n=1 Tax=Pleurodeles waltl TaxID=8319 RepID=A0AAV7N9K9_PLEWA|nr:hypothetical protein NDU88_007215 [Pleurodeles waltl]
MVRALRFQQGSAAIGKCAPLPGTAFLPAIKLTPPVTDTAKGANDAKQQPANVTVPRNNVYMFTQKCANSFYDQNENYISVRLIPSWLDMGVEDIKLTLTCQYRASIELPQVI